MDVISLWIKLRRQTIQSDPEAPAEIFVGGGKIYQSIRPAGAYQCKPIIRYIVHCYLRASGIGLH